MKKVSKFKQIKEKVADYLSDFPVTHFNQYTKEELVDILGKVTLNSKEDVAELVRYHLHWHLPIKMNFSQYLIDVKLERFRPEPHALAHMHATDSYCKEKQPCQNNIILKISHNVKRNRMKFLEILDYRAHWLLQLAHITHLYNTLCQIVGDDSGIHPSIIEEPEFGLLIDEKQKILHPIK